MSTGASGTTTAPAGGAAVLHQIARPGRELVDGLDRVLEGRISRLALVFVGLAAGWWLYVPVHELLHAWGCLAVGGEVSRLEIAPEYGGALFAQVVPFVVSGGEYAGRLSGFDDHGSRLVHLVTVFAPYLLTIFPGVWLMRKAVVRGSALGFGASLPVAMAPFIGLVGDAYEIGSLLTALLPAWADERFVGDDLFKVAASVASASDGVGVALGTLVGCAWAWATWAAGAAVAKAIPSRPQSPSSQVP